MIAQHTYDIQLLNSNDAKGVHYLTGFLVNEVVPAVSNAFMNTRDNLFRFGSFSSSFVLFGHLSLSFGKSLFICPKESGVSNLVTSRESSKELKPYINPHCFIRLGQRLKLDLAGEAGIPFIKPSPNRAGFNLAFNWSVKVDFDSPYLGEVQHLIFNAKTKLGIGEAIIPLSASESGIARASPSFDSSKESLKPKVNSLLHILKGLRVDLLKPRAFLFPDRQKEVRFIKADGFLPLFPGILTISKRLIIYPTALLKTIQHNLGLPFSRIYPILESLTHKSILSQISVRVNRKENEPHSSPAINCGAF
jgi:hypothetical protein